MPAPWEESYDKPRQCNKKQRQKKRIIEQEQFQCWV